MSGGSMDYLCYKVSDESKVLMNSRIPYHKAFGKHLALIAEALHDIEWCDSADKSPGDDKKAIMKCIEPKEVLSALIGEAEFYINKITEWIDECKKYE